MFTRGDADEVPADEPEPAPTDIGSQFPGSELEPGRYVARMLGVPVTFDVPATEGAPWGTGRASCPARRSGSTT